MFKFFKYEVKRTYKSFLFYFIGIIFFTNIAYFSVRHAFGTDSFVTLKVIISFVAFAAFCTIIGLTVYNFIKDYSATLYSNKSYFIFSLPLKISEIIYSKLLMYFIYFNMIISSMVLAISGLYIYEMGYNEFLKLFGDMSISHIFKAILYVESGLFYSITLVYLSISIIKSIFPRNRKKVALFYFIYLAINFIISTTLSLPNFSSLFMITERSIEFINLYSDYILLISLIDFIIGLIFSILSIYILNKKLEI